MVELLLDCSKTATMCNICYMLLQKPDFGKKLHRVCSRRGFGGFYIDLAVVIVKTKVQLTLHVYAGVAAREYIWLRFGIRSVCSAWVAKTNEDVTLFILLLAVCFLDFC